MQKVRQILKGPMGVIGVHGWPIIASNHPGGKMHFERAALIAAGLVCAAFAQNGAEGRRMAHLWSRPRKHPLPAAGSDQRRQLQQARSRVAIQDRQPRQSAGVQAGRHAADGQWRAVRDRRDRGARRSRWMRRRANCSGCTASMKARAAAAAPRQLSGRGLAYWTDGKEERILYIDARLPADRAGCEDRRADSDLRQERRGRSQARRRSDDPAGPHDRRDRHSIGAGGGEGHDHHRRGVSRRHDAEEHAQQQRLRARLRRAHGQAALDLPHDSGEGRVRLRHLGERLGRVHRQHRRLDADLGRRGARAGVSAGGIADGRLLRRASAGQQSVRRKPGVRRPENRPAQVALPAGASSAVGHGYFVGADSRGHHGGRQARSKRWRSRPSRAFCMSSIASRENRSGPSRSGRSRRAPCPANGIRRRSRSRPSRRPTAATALPIERPDRLHARRCATRR